MKRVRLLVVAALATASLGPLAAQASAHPVCNPDGICVDCSSNERVQVIWRKLFGHDAECE